MQNIRNLFIFILFAVGTTETPVWAGTLHLVSEGRSLFGDSAAIYSCIAYQGCGITTYELRDQTKLDIFTSKSLIEVIQNLSECDLSSANIRELSYFDQDQKKYQPIEWKKEGALRNLAPAILNLKVLNASFDLMGRLTQLKTDLDRVGEVIRSLEIKTFGYEVLFAKLGRQVEGATQHGERDGDKRVNLNQGLSIRDLPRVVRHEFDHVLQMKLANECGGTTTFSSHNRRERAAYLNDARFDRRNGEFWTLINTYRYSND